MIKKKLAYLISHGHTARGLTQTNLLGRLVNAGFDVSVISSSENDTLKNYCAQVGSTFIVFTGEQKIKSLIYALLRVYVLENIRNNPALWEKHLRRINKVGSGTKRKIMSHLFLLIHDFVRIFPFLKTFLLSYESYRFKDKKAIELLKHLNTDIVISTRPIDLMEVIVLRAARELNITKVLSILSWDNITCKGFFHERGDYYISWGKIMTEEIQEYYSCDKNRIYECGVTHFDVHYTNRLAPSIAKVLMSLSLHQNKPFIFFAMSSPYFAPDEIAIIEWLAAKIESNTWGLDMQLIIRPHVQNVTGSKADLIWINRLQELKSSRVSIDLPSLEESELTWSMKQDDMEKLSNLIAGCAISINSGSTIAIESILLNKPVILTMFDINNYPWWLSSKRCREFIHMRKFIDLQAATIVNNLDELEQSINLHLKFPKKTDEARKYAAAIECFALDGKSTERMVQALTSISNN